MTLSVTDIFLNTHVPPGSRSWSVQVPHLAVTVLHLHGHLLVTVVVTLGVTRSRVDNTLIRT